MIGALPQVRQIIGVSGGVLDTLMPMHLWIDARGRIQQAGPTIRKMLGREDVEGCDLFDLLCFRRPSRADTHAALMAVCDQRLALSLNHVPDLVLRGVVTRLPGASGAILDVSLGLSFARAVAEFGLTLSDFSPCDQTVELLYLHEANAATMRLSRHLTERLEAARATAEAQALTDGLTGLANRRAVDAELARLQASPEEEFTVLHLDLDLFKQVNDTFGHAAGDRVLLAVATILRSELRKIDIAGRVGGDEFIVLLRGDQSPEGLASVASRLIARIEQPVPFGGRVCRISASIGMTTTAAYEDRPSVERLLGDSDEALYSAKNSGRGRFVLHRPRPAGDAPQRRKTD